MTENDCPFSFEYKGLNLCALGDHCAEKDTERKLTCKNTSIQLNKGMTQEEINSLKTKIIKKISKGDSSINQYQMQSKPLDANQIKPKHLSFSPNPEKSIEEQRKDFKEKLKGFVIKD